ncbi:MAG: hypothetical protein CMG61_05640 [Candidatus Marinimicrobia bacterium]|nr:hypothetical protein [Candidatus Neomarinimicrobiota bacterium]|tara:strand:+ start:107 stop:1171 length:1065 start_codon:yes stop_codon:yes gene_type:complete
MNKILKESVYIIVLSLILGLISYFMIDDYNLFENDNANNIVLNEYRNLEPGVHLINIDYAKSLYDSNLGIFIDARELNDFNEGHIKKSLSIPFGYELKSSIIDSIENVFIEFNDESISKVLVTYCSGEGCSLSEDLAYEFIDLFPEQIICYFEEGYPLWKSLNYPVKAYKSVNEEINKPIKKSLLDFIDYLIIGSIILIFSLYLTKNYIFLIPIISRLILGFIFVYFSWDKILDPAKFADVIKNYDITPFNLEKIIALVLPYLELIIGSFLILGVFVEASTFISLSLLTFFIIMIGQAYLRGKSIDCGCLLSDLSDSSSSEKRIYMLKRIVQDICFIVYGVIVKYRIKFDIKND